MLHISKIVHNIIAATVKFDIISFPITIFSCEYCLNNKQSVLTYTVFSICKINIVKLTKLIFILTFSLPHAPNYLLHYIIYVTILLRLRRGHADPRPHAMPTTSVILVVSDVGPMLSRAYCNYINPYLTFNEKHHTNEFRPSSYAIIYHFTYNLYYNSLKLELYLFNMLRLYRISFKLKNGYCY